MTRPSEIISSKIDAIERIFSKYAVANPRIFGSVVNGNDNDQSDCDILVDLMPETSYEDLIALENELTKELGIRFEIKTSNEISRFFRQEVLNSARPLFERAA